MKGLAKKAMAYAESRGFDLERVNSKGFRIYLHPSGAEVPISPGLNDQEFANVRRQCDRAAGVPKDTTQKRRPEQIRAREEHRRELERLRQLAREKKNHLLSGAGRLLSRREADAITREIEAVERRIREMERLMQPAVRSA